MSKKVFSNRYIGTLPENHIRHQKQQLEQLQKLIRDFNQHTSGTNCTAPTSTEIINNNQLSDGSSLAAKENVCPNQISGLESSIEDEINTTTNCEDINKGEQFEYDLMDVVRTSQQLLLSDNQPFCQNLTSRKKKRDSDSTVQRKWENFICSLASSYGSKISDEHRQEILDVFRSCQPCFDCDAVEIDDNITQEFVFENTALKIRRETYLRMFYFQEQMARKFKNSSPKPINERSSAGLASRRRIKIKAGIEEAVGPILEELQDKLMRQSLINRLYLKDLLKAMATINMQDVS